MLSTFFGIIIGILAFLVALFFLYFGYTEYKNKGKLKATIPPMAFLFIVATLLGWGSSALLSKEEAKEEPAKHETDNEKTAAEKREAAEKKAQEEAKKAEEDTRKKEKAAKKTEEEKALKEADDRAKKEQIKQAYLKEIRPEIDSHTQVYDENWEKIWNPTMDAIANGSRDYYTAYNNLQVIKNMYQGGRNLVVAPVKGMDKADKKLLNTYESKMGDAFTFRVMAIELAQDGFSTGGMSPEDVNKMQGYIQMSEDSMTEAVAAISTIEFSLGIK